MKSRKVKLRQAWIWKRGEELFYRSKIIGYCLHVCCGKSKLGDVRVDLYPQDKATSKADYRHLPFRDLSFDTVICDPPWGKSEALDKGLRWLLELKRVARKRVIIIHNTIFKIPQFELKEVWCVNAAGILWKICSIYDRHTYPLEV